MSENHHDIKGASGTSPPWSAWASFGKPSAAPPDGRGRYFVPLSCFCVLCLNVNTERRSFVGSRESWCCEIHLAATFVWPSQGGGVANTLTTHRPLQCPPHTLTLYRFWLRASGLVSLVNVLILSVCLNIVNRIVTPSVRRRRKSSTHHYYQKKKKL